MIAPFAYYLREGKVKRKTPDPVEARSLLLLANRRLAFAKQQALTPETASFVLESAYEAAREAAQAVMSGKGYKPYSHEATIGFIKEYGTFSEIEITRFNRFRILRNRSSYDALAVGEADARDCLAFAEKFIERVEGLL